MSLGFAMEFLARYPLEENTKNKVFACIKEHHNKEFGCIESEICANADCYKFLTPRNIFKMFYNMRQNGYNFEEILMIADEKSDEKWNLLTLDICKKELEPNYYKIKKFIELSKHDVLSFINIGKKSE